MFWLWVAVLLAIVVAIAFAVPFAVDEDLLGIAVEVGIEDEGVDVDHRHHGVKVHERVAVRKFDRDDSACLAASEQRVCD